MATPYLTVAEFKARTLMPAVNVTALDSAASGWILQQLTDWSEQINARLRKRYAVPFSTPYPNIVLQWLTRIVTVRCYLKQGVSPQDPQFESIERDGKAAEDEIKEAANSEEGLYDLPLRGNTSESGISRGGPDGYSEASPYTFLDVQRDDVESSGGLFQ